ncbi:MAG TPA: sortase [Candidatus Saccharimonadales bacterium]|nr:sortase [Candidatus Saccharimonadales bacterium]
MTTPQTPSDDRRDAANPAADLIRQKLHQLYSDEPNAREELQESQTASHRSKHQQFMHDLSTSGRSLADIQTAWHNYYIGLPDSEKHEVWQEFYAEHAKHNRPPAPAQPQPVAPRYPESPTHRIRPNELRKVGDIKDQLLSSVNRRAATKKGGHLKSLLFGLSSGFIVVVILLFGFFNERFLAPFITPSKSVSATPIIIDPGTNSVGRDPKIIIPKINVEIPVVYTEPSIEDHAVQKALEQGVLHYATTSNPGELGNGVIFGHSSNNILNKGNYKFAFVLLKRLEAGDTFILQKDGKQYVYRVFAKKVVKPEDVAILNDGQGKQATFSLITCDPPGTSLNRLVVTGEQITPNPSANLASTAKSNLGQPKVLPSNSETLWHRFTNWLRN